LATGVLGVALSFAASWRASVVSAFAFVPRFGRFVAATWFASAFLQQRRGIGFAAVCAALASFTQTSYRLPALSSPFSGHE